LHGSNTRTLARARVRSKIVDMTLAVEIRQAQTHELDWVNTRYAQIGFAPSRANEVILIAEVDGEPAGLGRLVPLSDTSSELGGIFVFPKQRGRGIATRIVRALVAHAQAYETVYCIPFRHLTPFYKSFGFRDLADPAPEAVALKRAWCSETYPEPTDLLVLTPADAS